MGRVEHHQTLNPAWFIPLLCLASRVGAPGHNHVPMVNREDTAAARRTGGAAKPVQIIAALAPTHIMSDYPAIEVIGRTVVVV